MKSVVVLLGLLLVLGGAAVASLQYLPVDLDLSTVGGLQEFLRSQLALYVGAGAAALGLILFVAGLLPGRKQATGSSPGTTKPGPLEPKPAPRAAKAEATPLRSAAPPISSEAVEAAGRAPSPEPSPAPPQVAAPETPKPASPDPLQQTRQRISDLVTINDAIKAYHAKAGAYPAAYDGLKGEIERGKDWIPGLAPEFLAELPRDPARAPDNGAQYQYVSNGSGYKLIVHGVSADGSPVEVLGVRVDPARRNDNGFWAYGFWTEDFAAF